MTKSLISIARVVFVKCDVTKQDSVQNLIEQAEKLLDTELYCFINNAGITVGVQHFGHFPNIMMHPLKVINWPSTKSRKAFGLPKKSMPSIWQSKNFGPIIA